MNRVYLSKKGFKDLHKTISQLNQQEKSTMQAIRELDRSKSHDDRLYHAELLRELESIRVTLREKRDILKNACALPRKRDRLKVAIGSVVDLLDQQGQIMRYRIVDSIEANPSEGTISADSPLGQSLLGRTLKEQFQWSSGKRHLQAQLIRIS